MSAASIVISTRNRREELRAAIHSAFQQTASVEVIVVDDGSTDGTAEMVREEFPQARLVRHEESRGYIVRRNEAAQMAAPIILSIDDDAEFPSPETVEQTLRDFTHPRIGAVAIPYLEPRKANTIAQRAPTTGDTWVIDSYIGTAHAVRRDIFLKLGGYREQLAHQGEERDYCLRMLEAGFVVRLGNSQPILHHESPKRDFSRMDFYGRRNDILFAWHNVPAPYFLMHLLGTTINGFGSALRAGRCWKMVQGMVRGYADCFDRWTERRPVSPQVYRLNRALKKRGPRLLSEIEPLLPSVESC